MSQPTVFNQFDIEAIDKLNFQKELENKFDKHYLAFYEKAIKAINLGPIAATLLLFTVLLLLHATCIFISKNYCWNDMIKMAFTDFAILLPVLNALGFFLILSATDKLGEFISNLISLSKNNYDSRSNKLLGVLKNEFLHYRMLYYGVISGIINILLACLFGIPNTYLTNNWLLADFLLQVSLIGFLGGVTINATVIVIKLIRSVSAKDNIELMYLYPDKCAGTLIIGNILFKFSIHFIFIGIAIFCFLQVFPWTKLDNQLIKAILTFWKIFPFILSAAIFFIPAKKINKMLKDYKLFEQLRIRMRMNFIGQQMIQVESTAADSDVQLEKLDNHMQKLKQLDEYVTQMSTWPYNLQYRTTFLAVFLPAIIGAALEISQDFFKQAITHLIK